MGVEVGVGTSKGAQASGSLTSRRKGRVCEENQGAEQVDPHSSWLSRHLPSQTRPPPQTTSTQHYPLPLLPQATSRNPSHDLVILPPGPTSPQRQLRQPPKRTLHLLRKEQPLQPCPPLRLPGIASSSPQALPPLFRNHEHLRRPLTRRPVFRGQLAPPGSGPWLRCPRVGSVEQETEPSCACEDERRRDRRSLQDGSRGSPLQKLAKSTGRCAPLEIRCNVAR
ncbi:hypothetical protein L207DRAFT_131150 [Hyaloscypha variabilis F]|uniref:Uncharacterized protein n=1 Tax=Hyaloscypha variabilis (strain UAMH 11265 / GT02V1 / F) TaxID=1149755 RepID=A0A2J6R958_HYAVF|nr:hypothetical protein L207DRAFT_131150 [Hyaloscypha variabilis F]